MKKRSCYVQIDNQWVEVNKHGLTFRAYGKNGREVGGLQITGAGIAVTPYRHKNPTADVGWEKAFKRLAMDGRSLRFLK
jgi:hypothetical protein